MNKDKLGIPANHSLIQTDTKWEQRKGQNTDTYWYDETDEEGKVVAKYIVRDSTCIYPPQKRNITFDKISIDGQIIKSGSLSHGIDEELKFRERITLQLKKKK